MYGTMLLWLVVQILMVVLYWGKPQYSDAHSYISLASQCYNSGGWYPTDIQIDNDSYLFNPGYVNFLIVELKLFGSFLYHGIIGILLNGLLLLSIRSVIKNLLNSEAADYATILFCIMFSNMIAPVPVMSDLFFTCLLFASLALIRKNNWWLALSALIMCCANYTRPLLCVFALAILLYMLMQHFGWKRIAIYCVSYVVFSCALNAVVSHNTAAKDASGSTLGINLIMGANDSMNGTVNNVVFEEGNIGYVAENTNVYQKDSIWRNHAISWIVEHPVKYVSYIPVKLARLWWADNYMDLPLNNLNTSDTSKYSKVELAKRVGRILLLSLGYYISVVLMFLGLWRIRKRLLGYWGIFFIPIILACGMHSILYGGMRYHYSYIPIIILYATTGIMSIKDKELTFLDSK